MVVIVETGMELDVINVQFHYNWQRGCYYHDTIMMPVCGFHYAPGKQKRAQ